jgi:CIC family chloride channel protein
MSWTEPVRRYLSGLSSQARSRDRLFSLSHRSRQVLLLAGITGAVTGLVVGAFDWLTAEVLLDHVVELPVAAQVVVPTIGLLLAVGFLHLGKTTASTADEYIQDFHTAGDRLDLRTIPWKLLASIATLGSGGPLGYEGPSLLAGSAVGTTIQRRLRRFFNSSVPCAVGDGTVTGSFEEEVATFGAATGECGAAKRRGWRDLDLPPTSSTTSRLRSRGPDVTGRHQWSEASA